MFTSVVFFNFSVFLSLRTLSSQSLCGSSQFFSIFCIFLVQILSLAIVPPHPYQVCGMPHLYCSLLPPLSTGDLAVCMLLLRLWFWASEGPAESCAASSLRWMFCLSSVGWNPFVFSLLRFIMEDNCFRVWCFFCPATREPALCTHPSSPSWVSLPPRHPTRRSSQSFLCYAGTPHQPLLNTWWCA